ncbi:hypothetical protein QE152_g22237 [Popillia japonica]|uniref:Uncharacterized protein n=1 Tax=Popillia japonica TaxID=7064 RepID=A0AAW1KMF0_POPJA
MLGFGKRWLPANKKHLSDEPVSIIKVSSIRIDCNITTGAYQNGRLAHTLYQFEPPVLPGYAINVSITSPTYLPVTTNTIDDITITILDQEGRVVNFSGEQITIRLELKRLGWV